MKRERGKCRICRALRTKLFLKGEKCFSQKCPLVLRPAPPGEKPKKIKPTVSEYSLLLKEKQKLRAIYGLKDRQLRKYVKKILEKKTLKGDASVLLLDMLERRLDIIVWRAGFTKSRHQARQLVSHGFFEVDAKKVNIPSFEVKVGQKIKLREQKKNKKIVEKIRENLKEAKIPSFLRVDPENLEIELLAPPKVEEILPPVQIHSVFEFYAR